MARRGNIRPANWKCPHHNEMQMGDASLDPAMLTADGNVASQVFTPHTRGDDGFTISVWRDDAAMLTVAYRAGAHRQRIDRHKGEPMVDRTSFTRFRALRTVGSWDGGDPVAIASEWTNVRSK